VRGPSLWTSVGVAAAAHVALACALLGMHAAPGGLRLEQAAPESLFLVGEEPVLEPASLAPFSEPAAASRAAPSPGSRTTTRGPEEQPLHESAGPLPVPSAEPWSFGRPTPPAIGVDGYWKSIALAPGSDAPRVEAPPESARATRSPSRILRDGLDARDRELGLGSAGPLVSAAHEAASPSMAPDVGSATLEIDCDAGGRIVAARVLSASAAPTQWNAVARELVRIASARTLHVPAGARGVRARLRIVAERSLPSGTKATPAAGAVPDDVVGGADKACVGEGVTRKCLAGMPVGATGNLFDVADVGAKAARVVRVFVLGEETL
jgi:hypothetical protein